MTNILLLIIIVIMLYQIYKESYSNDEVSKKQKSYNELLPFLKGKYCEISWNDYIVDIDHLQSSSMSTKCYIVDFDDDWIVIDIHKKKEVIREVMRKSLISDIKEIYEHE